MAAVYHTLINLYRAVFVIQLPAQILSTCRVVEAGVARPGERQRAQCTRSTIILSISEQYKYTPYHITISGGSWSVVSMMRRKFSADQIRMFHGGKCSETIWLGTSWRVSAVFPGVSQYPCCRLLVLKTFKNKHVNCH